MKNSWFCDDFDYRANSDDNPELMDNIGFLSRLNPLTRDLMESADWFIILGDAVDQGLYFELCKQHYDPETNSYDIPPKQLEEMATLHNVPIKTIRRRNPEFQSQMDIEDMDAEDQECLETDSEDALDHADSIIPSAPKAKFDLIEIMPRKPMHSWYSADWFPHAVDKRLSGYSRNLKAAVTRGMSAKALFSAIEEARARKVITDSQVKRLWELFDQSQFLSNPEAYKKRVAARKARKLAAQAAKK